MIQTQQQAIKPNKTSTRQNVRRARHPVTNEESDLHLTLNPDCLFDMPLVESNLLLLQPNSEIKLYTTNWTIIFNQSQSALESPSLGISLVRLLGVHFSPQFELAFDHRSLFIGIHYVSDFKAIPAAPSSRCSKW
jgi:hypothetical protein